MLASQRYKEEEIKESKSYRGQWKRWKKYYSVLKLHRITLKKIWKRFNLFTTF